MPRTRLTAKSVQNFPAPDNGRIEYWDEHTRGLGLRVTDKGVKSWTVMYRLGGRQRRLTLGSYPALDLAAARDLALEVLGKIAKGIDPAEEKQVARQEQASKNDLASLLEEYIDRRVRPRNRTWKDTKSAFDRYIIPHWGKRDPKTIQRREVIDLLDGIAGPYMANRVRAALSAFFNWLLERSKIDASPLTNVKPLHKETARDRVLSDAEIEKLWVTWDKMGWPFGAAFKMLLLTGQRRGEVFGMRWADIDLNNALWTLPREATKADRLHEVPLSDGVLDILRQAPRIGDYVFTTKGDRPASGFSVAKRRSDKLSEMSDWRLHDLRRTAASGMARLGVDPHIIEKVLNHSTGMISGVAAVYNRHGYLEEKRRALSIWTAHLFELFGEAT